MGQGELGGHRIFRATEERALEIPRVNSQLNCRKEVEFAVVWGVNKKTHVHTYGTSMAFVGFLRPWNFQEGCHNFAEILLDVD